MSRGWHCLSTLEWFVLFGCQSCTRWLYLACGLSRVASCQTQTKMCGLEFLYSVLILSNQENFIVHIQAFVHHILLAHLQSILSLLKGVMWLKCPESGRDLKIGTNSEIANFEISMQISRLPIFRRRFELLSLILSECMKPANGKRKCTKGKMLKRYNLR